LNSVSKTIEKSLEILLGDKNNRKANSSERNTVVIVDLFREHYNDIISFNEMWTNQIDKTNRHIK
jgi:hypothetical protein